MMMKTERTFNMNINGSLEVGVAKKMEKNASKFRRRNSRQRQFWLWLLLLSFPQHGLVTSFAPRLSTDKLSILQSYDSDGSVPDNSMSLVSSFMTMQSQNNKTIPYNFWGEDITIVSFNMDLHNLVMDDPLRAIDYLEIMEAAHERDPSDRNLLRPDSASYTTVIEGLCCGNHDDAAAERAQALLEKMERSTHLEPNQLTYSLVCQKWAELYKNDFSGANAQKAHNILLALQEENKQPTAKLYSIVLEGWCRRIGKVPHAMEEVERLLREMEALGGTVRPNVVTYTSVIGGLARSRYPDLATRADEMLTRMKTHGVEPDMVAYTSTLNCWGRAVSWKERERASDRALEILRKMEDMYVKEEIYHVKPSIVTYVTAIRAIGNSLHPDAPKIAEDILWHMYNLTKTGTIHIPPTVGVWNAVITCYSKAGTKARKLQNAQRAEKLMVEMMKRSKDDATIEPNVKTWGGVLRAWAGSTKGDSGDQAQRVFNLMQKWYDEGRISTKPNVICYTTVMNAWGRGNAPPKVAIAKVEGLLQRMENLYEETLDLDIRPSKITYVTALDVFSRKCKDTVGSRAQATIDRMMRLYSKGLGHDRPTRIIFNALINAWSKSTEPNAAENAEKIFRWMEAQYRTGDDFVKPDRVTLCGVLNAWANNAENGGAQRAQEILDHTESLTLQERGFAHSIIVYNILIKAWGRSRSPDSVRRAEHVLKRLEDKQHISNFSIRPDITTYSSMINCCAYYAGDYDGRAAAFQVALRTFNRIEEIGDKPNHITYGTIFKAINKLTPMDKSREELIKSLFRKCCQEGQVDAFVLSQIKAACPAELFQKLVNSQRSQPHGKENNRILSSLPHSWRKNVVEQR